MSNKIKGRNGLCHGLKTHRRTPSKNGQRTKTRPGFSLLTPPDGSWYDENTGKTKDWLKR